VPNLDIKLLDSPAARYMTLERLVREKVWDEAVKDAHLITSDTRLARELQQSPMIASLRKPDGSLDMERYRQLAASQGLTPDGFEARVRTQLTTRQMETAASTTAFTPAALADVALNAFYERREVQIMPFAMADYKAKVNPTDAEIEAYYQANPNLFQAPEAATVEYAVLDLDTVKKSIVLNESDLKTYYEQNVARLSGKEERRASHILINAPKDMPAEARKAARDKAQALLEQVRKAPDSFADVAKKNSQDTGSAPNGGDLDYFGRGAMVKPFEDAAFALKKGDISDVVESDFGFHIIKVTDIKAPKQRTFEELRPSMEADLKTQQAQRKFAEVAPSQLAAARVVEYTPARTKPLAEVRGNVKERLVASQAAELAKKDGAEKLAAWKQTAPANLAAPVVVSRENAQAVPAAVLDAVLQADATNLPAWVGVDLGAQGYTVARVNKVLPSGTPAAAAAEQGRKQFAQSVGNAESQAYYKLLTQRFKVQIKVPRPSATALGQQTATE